MGDNENGGHSNGLRQELHHLSILLTTTVGKLDTTNQRLDDVVVRIEQSEEHRDQICALHMKSAEAAEEAAKEANRIAAAAMAKAQGVESSWSIVQRRPGSSEHKSITAALEERAKAKEAELADLEQRVAERTAKAIAEQIRLRDQAKKEALEEQRKLQEAVEAEEQKKQQAIEADELKKKKTAAEETAKEAARTLARRRMITFAIRSAIAIIGALGATGLFSAWSGSRHAQQTAQESREEAQDTRKATLKALRELEKQLRNSEKVIVVPSPPLPVTIPKKTAAKKSEKHE